MLPEGSKIFCNMTNGGLGFHQPDEITDIYGDPTKAKKMLGWEFKRSFFEVLDILIEEHL